MNTASTFSRLRDGHLGAAVATALLLVQVAPTPGLAAAAEAPARASKSESVGVAGGFAVGAAAGGPIGALVGVLPRDAAAPAAPLPGEMLVMAHFRPGLLEGMLQGWRAAHIPPVALKAMLTDTNAAWTAPALYAEIAKEHAAMHSGGRAHKA